MVKTDFQSVDEYIASQPESVRALLERVRSAYRKAIPGAENMISYKIPTYKLGGRPAGDLFPPAGSSTTRSIPSPLVLLAAFGEELALYEVNKGTIRFPLSGALSPSLGSQGIAKLRARELADRAAARAAGPKRR